MNESSMREALLEQSNDPLFEPGRGMLDDIVASEERRARRLAQSAIAVWTAWLFILGWVAFRFVSEPLIQISLGGLPNSEQAVPIYASSAGATAPQYYIQGAPLPYYPAGVAPTYNTPGAASPRSVAPITSNPEAAVDDTGAPAHGSNGAPVAYSPAESYLVPLPNAVPLTAVPGSNEASANRPNVFVLPVPVPDGAEARPLDQINAPQAYAPQVGTPPVAASMTLAPAQGAVIAPPLAVPPPHSIANSKQTFGASVISVVGLVGVPVLPVIGSILLVLAILARRSATLTQIRCSLGVIEFQLKQLGAAQKGSSAAQKNPPAG